MMSLSSLSPSVLLLALILSCVSLCVLSLSPSPSLSLTPLALATVLSRSLALALSPSLLPPKQTVRPCREKSDPCRTSRMSTSWLQQLPNVALMPHSQQHLRRRLRCRSATRWQCWGSQTGVKILSLLVTAYAAKAYCTLVGFECRRAT